LYEDEMMRYREDAVQEFENIKIMGPGRLRLKKFLKLQTRMVGFRYVPFELKRFCMYYTWEFNNTRLENDVPIYSQDNLDFYRDLSDKECSLVNEKMFKLYHLEGAHEPFRYDADLNVIENGTHEKNVEAAIKLAQEFINNLKDEGAYDKSAVIITADHGQSDEDIPEDRIHPVFFAKGIGESADRMRISEAPVSFEDLQEAYDKLLSGSSGRDIFEWKDDEKRERRCYVYSYPDELHNVEYILKGHAGDLDSLMRVTE
ncbi:MAG: alkaline phosphatase family protein, partial [Lachnospiraceae bacterium]|nr:alkaline phosphatase family protein [Lachnospiraceae bacterium]